MQIKIGKPRHGWLPISIAIGGQCKEFCASNVVNDPLTDLLFAAMWSIAPDYSFPKLAAGVNSPLVGPRLRSAHFWLEPAWHTLVVQQIVGTNQVDLWFTVSHEAGLFVDGNDILSADLTLCSTESTIEFANSVYSSIALLIDDSSSEFAEHWRRPFPYAVFDELGRWLKQITDTENRGMING